jgi:ABC-type glycerol-3-phosphate transport system substrate-binding protein
MSRRTLVASFAVVVALVAAACGGSSSSPPTSSSVAATRPSSSAVLSIISPTNGQVIHGSTVDLKVSLVDATLVPVTSTTLVPNEGHLHVILDDALISMTSGLETTIPNVPAGKHLIKVEFVANDHAPFDPRVIVGVAFTTVA